MTTPKLTAPQRMVLEVAAAGDVPGSNRTDETVPCVSTVVAERLGERGLLKRADWTGRVWVYRITAAGRRALEVE